jgi:hypothetical protein
VKKDEVSKSTIGGGGKVLDMVMGNNYESYASPWRQSTGDAYYGKDVPPK